MAQNYKAGLIITGDASGGIRAIKATEGELSKLNQGFGRGSRDSRRFGSDAERAGQQVREIGHGSTEASKGLSLVRQAATLAMAAFSIRQLAAYADGWSELNSRVLNVTKDVDVSEQTMGRLAETARSTYSALNQTAEAFLNNATTLTELGYSTERQLDLSDALNNSLVISATRGQQAESVLQALSRAFAAGELRGDNFNTVIQNGGRMAEALADGLGVTTIELRKMAAEGELTTSRVFEALTSQMEVLRKEAEEMPATIEDGWTLIGNASMELVGRLDKAFGASEGVAGVMVDAADAISASIDPLIDNMDTIQDVAVLTAAVVGGRYAAAFASSAQRIASNTAETVANTRANVAATAAARTKAAEVLRVAQAEQAAAARALANGHAIAAATGNTTLRTRAITQMAAANQRAIAAEAAHTAAVNANAAAMQRSTVSAYAMAAASRAASGALALVGGPVGAAILAGTAAYYFRDSLGFTSAAAREAKQDIDQLVESLDNYTHAQYQSNRVTIVQNLAEARIEAEKLESQLASLEGQRSDQGTRYQGGDRSVAARTSELNAQLLEQRRIVATQEEGLRDYDQAWRDVLESQVTGVSIFRTLDQWLMTNGDTVSETSRRFNALGDTLGEGGEKWDDYISKLQAARDVMGMTAAESAQYAAVQQGFTGLYADQAAAVAGQTDALSDYRKAIADGNSTEAEAHLARAQRYAEAEAMVLAQLDNIDTLTNLLQGVQTELSATALSAALVVGDGAGAMAANVSTAIQAINDRAAAIRQTTTVTIKNTAANREAEKAAREAEQAAEAQASALRSIQEEMDPLLRDHATYIDRVGVLEEALAAGTLTEVAFAEARRWAAEQYTRAATGAEEYEKQTASLVSTYDRHNQKARQLRDALDQINLRWQNDPENAAQYARMVANVRDEMDQLAKESEYGSDRISQSFTTWGTVADNTLRSVDDAGRDAWLGLVDGSTSALDTVERAFQQTFANIAHMLTTQQLTFQVAGMMGLDTTGMPGAQGGGMQGMMNNINPGMLQNGWETVSGWWGGGSTAVAGGGGLYANAATGASQGGLYGNAVTGGVAQSGGGWMGGSMQNYQGMGAVYNMGASLAGGYVGGEVGSSVTGKTANSNYGETAGSLVGSYWGPWGAAAGSAIGSFVDSLFGSNKKTYDFDFEQGGHHGVFGDRSSELGDFGLTALSDYKLGEQQDALQELLTSVADFDNVLAGAAIDERVDAMRASIEGFRHSGPEDLFDTRLREIINGSGAYVESAIAAIADPEQMADAFVSVLNLERIATSLNDQIQRDVIDHLEANTGDVQGTVGGLAQALDATVLLGNSVDRLNLQFETTAEGAIHSAWALQEAAGGIDNMTAVNDAYYQAAFSETERLSNAQEDLFASLSSVTDQTPHTVEELRALVEAQNLNSAAGGELAYELMALAPALKETSTAVRQAIEQQYQDVLGRTPDAGGLEYWFDQVSSGAITLDDALEHMAGSAEAADYAASGAANSLDGMADALRAQEQLQRQLWQAQGNTDAIRQLEIDRLSDLETAEVDNLTAMQRRIWAIEDENAAQQAAERAQQDRIRAIDQEANAWARARNELAGFGNTINGWLANHDATEQGMGTPRERLEASGGDFWAQYEKAQQGDRNARQSITQFADRAIDNLQEFYASSDPGVNGIAEIRDAMERLPEMLSPEQFLAEEFRGIIGGQTGALVGAMDLNGDGTVSAIERAIAADWDSSDLLKNVLHQEMLRLGTTVLTDAQIRAALKPHATNAEIDRLIQRVDANGDGIVSAQELANARLSGLGAGIVSAMATEFDGIDVNASGLIDYDEFHNAFAGMASETTLDKLFWLMDKNGDGQISRLESIAASNMTIAELGLMRQEGDTDDIMGGNPSVIDDIVNKYPATDPTAGKIDAAYHDVLGKAAQGFQVNSWARWLEEKDSRAGQLHQAVAWANLPVGGREWLIERDLYGDGTVPKFANGGVFSNSIVNRPTMFDMGLMGEAGPEAIVPLSRGAGGRLGIDATGLMQLPDGPQQLPMPEMPPLPQFPALSQSDVVQALNDVKRELVETHKENKRLLELIGDNTRDTADAVEEYGERAEGQRVEEIDALESISRNSNTRSVTT